MLEFLLISRGKSPDLLDKIKKLEGVKEVYEVFGFDYDVIVKIEGDSFDSLREMEKKIAKLTGVKSILKFPERKL